MRAAGTLRRLRRHLPLPAATEWTGRVRRMVGSAVEAVGITGQIGDLCRVRGPGGSVALEIVGFRDGAATLLPLERLDGIGPDAPVLATCEPLRVPVGESLLGRVLDGLGRPIDDLGPLQGAQRRTLHAAPPDVLRRRHVVEPLLTGVRSIDLMTTLGQGQRIGIFSGSGVGKSTLLGMILRECAADVTVLALIGERGREVRQFLDHHLPDSARRRTLVVAATSDRPALQRIKGAHLAATAAEYFRDLGSRVLLVMDSATRLAMAIREAGLAAGEPPTTRGYPPSLYSELPRLVERFGTSEHGSVTALLTVLVEGDDLTDPAADCLRGLLDGHLLLSRSLAERGHYPAVDVLKSISRLMEDVTEEPHREAARTLRSWLSLYEEHRDLIEVGAYQRGSQPQLDRVLDRLPAIEALLRQDLGESTPFEEALTRLCRVVEPERKA